MASDEWKWFAVKLLFESVVTGERVVMSAIMLRNTRIRFVTSTGRRLHGNLFKC